MDDLAAESIGALCANDRVGRTRPSPRLYPHQWSWDAAFVAMGWAHADPAPAATELHALFQPFTGERLGSRAQSWTAAVALDWLAQDSAADQRPAPALADRDHDLAAGSPTIVA